MKTFQCILILNYFQTTSFVTFYVLNRVLLLYCFFAGESCDEGKLYYNFNLAFAKYWIICLNQMWLCRLWLRIIPIWLQRAAMQSSNILEEQWRIAGGEGCSGVARTRHS